MLHLLNLETGYKCNNLPTPVNGRMKCLYGGDGNSQYTCSLSCNDGYVPDINADVIDHVCNDTNNSFMWSPPFAADSSSYVCLGKCDN